MPCGLTRHTVTSASACKPLGPAAHTISRPGGRTAARHATWRSGMAPPPPVAAAQPPSAHEPRQEGRPVLPDYPGWSWVRMQRWLNHGRDWQVSAGARGDSTLQRTLRMRTPVPMRMRPHAPACAGPRLGAQLRHLTSPAPAGRGSISAPAGGWGRVPVSAGARARGAATRRVGPRRRDCRRSRWPHSCVC